MARLPRIIYDNAFYHVMNRGGNFQSIFRKDKHRRRFLNLLDEAWQTFDLRVHAYCLMGNHYHLLLQVPESNLSQAMHHIGSSYTQGFNRLEKRDGPLFRGRYKAILIDSDTYLARLSRYIHRNPVEAQLVTKASQYPWSSYRAYLQMVKRPNWLEVDPSIAQISPTKSIKDYQKFVENPNIPSLTAFFERKHVPAVLGDAWFKGVALSRAQGTKDIKETLCKHLKERPGHRHVIKVVALHYGTKPEKTARREKGLPQYGAQHRDIFV